MNRVFVGLFLLSSFIPVHESFSSDCEIEGFYKGIIPTEGTKVLTSSDELEEATLILVPMDIDKGSYVVEITRKASNLYKVDGKNIYVQTRYCYEYSYGEEVVLKVEGSYEYNKGKIIF